MAKNRGLFHEIIAQAAAQLSKNIEQIHKLIELPIGKEVLTPRQVKEKYGLGVREIEALAQQHGQEAVDEILPLLERESNA